MDMGPTAEVRRRATENQDKEPQPENPGGGTTEYCASLQNWMWGVYWGGWPSGGAPWGAPWGALSAFPLPGHQPAGQTAFDGRYFYPPYPPYSTYPPYPPYPTYPPSPVSVSAAGGLQPHPEAPARPLQQQQDGNPPQAGREYVIPTPLHRFLAETVDFFILFCVKATIVLWIMHLSGMKDIAKFITHFIVEEIDENTSMEDLQKMMVVALVYRILVCFYEIICIWGAGGATPGKFLLGLRVVTCDTSVLVRPNRVLVVPASNVTLSASTVRALNKNFSIAFLFPIFITLLFFQHNRTVYDIVAGTIVVQRRGAR